MSATLESRLAKLERRGAAACVRCPDCGGLAGVRGVVYLDDEPGADLAPCPRCGARPIVVQYVEGCGARPDESADPVGGVESLERATVDPMAPARERAPEIRKAMAAAGRREDCR